MITMKEVAEAAGVSRATVSRVLSNHPSIRPETRSCVMHWVRELGYEPNQIAQSLAGNKVNLIGVLFSDLSNPLYAALMTAIVQVAEREGYSVIVGDAQREKAREVNIIKSFQRRKVDGLIVRPIGQPNQRFYGNLKLPMVSLYKKINRKSIIISSEEGGRQVAQHFYDMGHRFVGYLGPIHSQSGNDKLAGFQTGLGKYGLEATAILECNQHETAENQQAYTAINQYFDRKGERSITAWFAHSDIAASDIIRALIERGVHVPQEVAVCGYNDTLLARKMIPTLTSVASPIDEIARNAMMLLIDEIKEREEKSEKTLIKGDLEENEIYLSPHLNVRESTVGSMTG